MLTCPGKELERTLAGLGSEALFVQADVSSEADTLEMAKKTVARFGRIDILVNNAGMVSRPNILSRRTPFYELSLDEWNKTMAVNVTGAFLCCRAVFPYMKAQGGGKVINTSSGQLLAMRGNVKYAHYMASKGAVVGLTRALAREMGEFNITVNCIAPGSVLTEDKDDAGALKLRQEIISDRCIKRVEYPEDLVGTAVFLASPESDFITGQTLIVDGGGVFL